MAMKPTTQLLKVRVPDDDWEVPVRLVQEALERYLDYGDRWREVTVELVGTLEEES